MSTKCLQFHPNYLYYKTLSQFYEGGIMMNLEQILKQCGFHVKYRGFRALEECVRLALEDEAKLLSITALYKEVALSSHVQWSAVERSIRVAVTYAWRYGGRKQMERVFRCQIPSKPTAGEMIELLVNYIQAIQDKPTVS